MAALNIPSPNSPYLSSKTSNASLRFRIASEDSLGPVGDIRRASSERMPSPPLTGASPRPILPRSSPSLDLIPDLSQSNDRDHAHTPQFGWNNESLMHDRWHDSVYSLIGLQQQDSPRPSPLSPLYGPEFLHEHHQHEQLHPRLETSPPKTLYAGPAPYQKRFEVPMHLIAIKSRYFQRLFELDPAIDHFIYDDADATSMSLLVHWLHAGTLDRPDGFHSLTHWFGLYVLSLRFEMEELRNSTIDTLRSYYRTENQTAPPFRLEFVYRFVQAPDRLCEFIVGTAAMRCIENGFLSESMRQVLAKGGDLAVDFAESLVHQVQNPARDTRRGPDCEWHVHHFTPLCGELGEGERFDGACDAGSSTFRMQDMTGSRSCSERRGQSSAVLCVARKTAEAKRRADQVEWAHLQKALDKSNWTKQLFPCCSCWKD